MRRPLAKALYTHDVEILGELLTTSKIGVQFAAGKSDTTARHLSVLHEHGLLSDDQAADSMLSYRLSATVTGSFLLEGIPGATEIDLTDKADALATTVRRAFEPATEPIPEMLHSAAADLTELYMLGPRLRPPPVRADHIRIGLKLLGQPQHRRPRRGRHIIPDKPNHGNEHSAIASPSRSAGPRPRPGATNAISARSPETAAAPRAPRQ